MRPDLVDSAEVVFLVIHNAVLKDYEEEREVLTYLYDAKYRVVNDKKLDKDLEPEDIAESEQLAGGDYLPTDSINQMPCLSG